jgi:sugar diacid utilization regulator
MPRVALAYLRERAELDWTRREGRQHLAAALLAGRPAQRSAQRYGHRLADRYLVLAAHLPEPPADPDSRAATAWFRRVQVALDAQPDLLSSFDRDGAALLLPAPPDPAGQRAAVDGVLRRLSEAVGGDCRAGVALAADHAAIPDAHTLAAELAQLAGTLRRPPGGYWLDDLAVEYQLARPGPARACLAELLAPLRPNPHLLDALRAFIAAGYRRSEAAAALRVHRNTLTYRLHRVHALTGYDATAPRDAQLLTAAMTAHDIATTRPR